MNPSSSWHQPKAANVALRWASPEHDLGNVAGSAFRFLSNGDDPGSVHTAVKSGERPSDAEFGSNSIPILVLGELPSAVVGYAPQVDVPSRRDIRAGEPVGHFAKGDERR